MYTISIINLKGGVGKTISAVTIAYLLSLIGYGVLIVDNDKQGNASKMLNMHNTEKKGIEYILTERVPNMAAAIQRTEYNNLDCITANMSLLNAILEIQLDQKRPMHGRLKKALSRIDGQYDFCVIDNAPDINASTINALVASDGVMIPVMIDDFSLDGLEELAEQIENTREELNPQLDLLGCFVTSYISREEADRQGDAVLREKGFPVFDTRIRRSAKVKEATFARVPLPEYSKYCAAAVDYRKLTAELLERAGHEKEE